MLIARFFDFSDSDSGLSFWVGVLTLLITLVAGIYLYSTWHHKHWTNMGVPQDKPVPILGTDWRLLAKPEPDIMLANHQKYGKVYGGYSGRNPFLWIADANIVQQICIKDFANFTDRHPLPLTDRIFSENILNLKGNDWKRVRKLTSPAFTTAKLKKMQPIIKQSATELINNVNSLPNIANNNIESLPVEIMPREIFGSFTMDTLTQCLFGSKSKQGADEKSSFSKQMEIFLNPSRLSFLPFLFMPTCLVKLFGLGPTPRSTVKFLENFTHKVVTRRRVELLQNQNGASDESMDFLRLLITARDSDNRSTAALTDFEIQCSTVIFTSGGYDTISLVLSFAVYSLALHQDVQERLYQELLELDLELESNLDPDDNYDQLNAALYLNAVIHETLRVFPPAFKIDRVAAADYQLPAPYSHVTVKKGQQLVVSILGIHNDPDYWPEPEKFDPDRFMPANKSAIVPQSFLAFGAGLRNCVGMRFALMQVKIALAAAVMKFRFIQTAATDDPLKWERLTIVLQPKRLIVGVEPR